jgi:hypothetical protein
LAAGYPPISSLEALDLWITRDFLWINAFRCGEVGKRGDLSLNIDPKIWAWAWASAEIWIGQKQGLPVDKLVDESSEYFPQGELIRLSAKTPTSRLTPA